MDVTGHSGTLPIHYTSDVHRLYVHGMRSQKQRMSPFSGSPAPLAGFSIIEATSIDEVTNLVAQRLAHARRARLKLHR
jgi:hypothetical protein